MKSPELAEQQFRARLAAWQGIIGQPHWNSVTPQQLRASDASARQLRAERVLLSLHTGKRWGLSAWKHYRRHLARKQLHRQLSRLSERHLADIGLTRGDVEERRFDPRRHEHALRAGAATATIATAPPAPPHSPTHIRGVETTANDPDFRCGRRIA